MKPSCTTHVKSLQIYKRQGKKRLSLTGNVFVITLSACNAYSMYVMVTGSYCTVASKLILKIFSYRCL